jgi:hypothetical protein
MIILFLLSIIFIVLFSSDQNNKTEHVQVLTPLVNPHTKYQLPSEQSTPTHTEDLSSQTLPQSLNTSALDTAPNDLLASLDDESLLNISDVLENSLVPVYLNNSESLGNSVEQKVAIDIFVSRLPEGLGNFDFQKIKVLLRDYLPYDLADSLALEVEKTYRLDEQEQIYLSSMLANNKAVKTMAEQIAIANHLVSLKGGEIQQDSNFEPSQALSTWQKTQEKIEKIQSTAYNPNQEIYAAIELEYGSTVADDYLELSNIETMWQEKYAIFLGEKNLISKSGLSEEDKVDQIDSLIRQHYEENEWAAVRAYDAMMSEQPDS